MVISTVHLRLQRPPKVHCSLGMARSLVFLNRSRRGADSLRSAMMRFGFCLGTAARTGDADFHDCSFRKLNFTGEALSSRTSSENFYRRSALPSLNSMTTSPISLSRWTTRYQMWLPCFMVPQEMKPVCLLANLCQNCRGSRLRLSNTLAGAGHRGNCSLFVETFHESRTFYSAM